jgi:hypothetical protein
MDVKVSKYIEDKIPRLGFNLAKSEPSYSLFIVAHNFVIIKKLQINKYTHTGDKFSTWLLRIS